MSADGNRLLRWMGFAVLIGIALLFCGCSSATPPDLDPKVIRPIVEFFMANHGLAWTRVRHREAAEAIKHKVFFVYRRANDIGKTKPQPLGGQALEDLKAQIGTELTAVEAFVRERVGSNGHNGTLTGGGGDKTPPHLDLADVAKTHVNTPDTAVRTSRQHYLGDRRRRIPAIAWRAAALHPRLWTEAPDHRSSTLDADALAEVLDRRLRAVERMNYQISKPSALGRRHWSAVSGPDGPWKDGFRVRMFEYPRLDPGSDGPAIAAIGDANIADIHNLPSGLDWHLESNLSGRLIYKDDTKLRKAVKDDFPPSSDSYVLDFWPRAGRHPAQVVDDLFTPDEDYRERSWCYCDHVLAALHIEGLRFGRRRRTGDDAAFNDIVTGHSRGYVQLAPVVGDTGALDEDRLMADDDDPYFDNAEVPIAHLQIGDQLIFWNSMLYPVVSKGEWKLENAIVVEIGSDGIEGGIEPKRLKIMGHGTEPFTLGQYTAMLRNKVRFGFEEARRTVTAGAATATHHSFLGRGHLVKWNPFDDAWNRPGPWWVAVAPKRGESVDHAVTRLGIAVRTDPAYPSQPPQIPEFGAPSTLVYVPLYKPQYGATAWVDYLTARRGGPVRVSRTLVPVIPDNSVVPGLAYPGAPTPDAPPVVRPKPVV